MAKLCFSLGSHESLDFVLEAGLTRVGRDAANEVVIDNSWISSFHAEIRTQGQVLMLKDLNSSNGTTVNRTRITEHQLQHGDRIFFGQVEAIFDDGKPGAPAAAAVVPVPRVVAPAKPVMIRALAPPPAQISPQIAPKEALAGLEAIQQETTGATAAAEKAVHARALGERELENLKTIRQEAEAAAALARKELVEAQESLDATRRAQEEGAAALSASREEAGHFREAVEALRRQKLAYQTELEAIQTELASRDTARQETEAARQETASALQETVTARAEAEAARMETEAARTETEAARTETEAARTETETARTETEAARTEAEAARTETEAAHTETEAARAEAEAARREMTALQAETTALRTETAALQAAQAQAREESREWLQKSETLDARRKAAGEELSGLQTAIASAREAAAAELRRGKEAWEIQRAAALTATDDAIRQKDAALEEILTLETRLESLRRDTGGAEALSAKVRDLRQQQSEAERRLENLHDQLDGMSEAPDPNWGTVHSLALRFIKKLDLLDDLIAQLRDKPETREALARLEVFRSGLLDVLKEYTIESYSLAPGTVIDPAARNRIQIVETLSEGGHDGTRIVRTCRPGYVCLNGDLGISTLLRKADVAVSIPVG